MPVGVNVVDDPAHTFQFLTLIISILIMQTKTVGLQTQVNASQTLLLEESVFFFF